MQPDVAKAIGSEGYNYCQTRTSGKLTIVKLAGLDEPRPLLLLLIGNTKNLDTLMSVYEFSIS